MHQNLVTTFSLDKKLNDFNVDEGYQQLRSDSQYGSFFTIYGKLNTEKNSDFYKLNKSKLYIQNFSGAITMGIEKIDDEINLIFDLDTLSPVWLLNVTLKVNDTKSVLENHNHFINTSHIKNSINEIDQRKKINDDMLNDPNTNDLVKEQIKEEQILLDNGKTQIEDYLKLNQTDFKLTKDFKIYVNIIYPDFNETYARSKDFNNCELINTEMYERFGEIVSRKIYIPINIMDYLKDIPEGEKKPYIDFKNWTILSDIIKLNPSGGKYNPAKGTIYTDKCHPFYVQLID